MKSLLVLAVILGCVQADDQLLGPLEKGGSSRISHVKKRDVVVNNQVLLNRADDHPTTNYHQINHHGSSSPLSSSLLHGVAAVPSAASSAAAFDTASGVRDSRQAGLPSALLHDQVAHGYQAPSQLSSAASLPTSAFNADIFRNYANLGQLLLQPGVRDQVKLFRQAVAGPTLTAMGPGVVDGSIVAPAPVITKQAAVAAATHPLSSIGNPALGIGSAPFESFKQGVASPALSAFSPEDFDQSILTPAAPVITKQTPLHARPSNGFEGSSVHRHPVLGHAPGPISPSLPHLLLASNPPVPVRTIQANIVRDPVTSDSIVLVGDKVSGLQQQILTPAGQSIFNPSLSGYSFPPSIQQSTHIVGHDETTLVDSHQLNLPHSLPILSFTQDPIIGEIPDPLFYKQHIVTTETHHHQDQIVNENHFHGDPHLLEDQLALADGGIVPTIRQEVPPFFQNNKRQASVGGAASTSSVDEGSSNPLGVSPNTSQDANPTFEDLLSLSSGLEQPTISSSTIAVAGAFKPSRIEPREVKYQLEELPEDFNNHHHDWPATDEPSTTSTSDISPSSIEAVFEAVPSEINDALKGTP